MRKKFRLAFTLPFIALLSGHGLSVVAQTPAVIGKILVATGRVEARNAAGIARELTRGSEIFGEDTIILGADGSAQIRLVDDATFSLRPNTEFTFDEYDFDADPATPDSAVMSMLRGGFRTISGSIGDDDADNYRIDTPLASIGIRGTEHEALIVDGVLYTGVFEGGTTVSNNAGNLDTGIGADFDFSATHPGEAPEGLLQQPAALGQLDLNPGIAENEEAGDGSDEPPFFATGDTGNGDADSSADTEQSITALDALLNSAGPGMALAGGNPDSAINPVLNIREAENLGDAGNDEPGTDPEPTPDPEPDPNPGPGPNPEPEPDPAPDPEPGPGPQPNPDPEPAPDPDPSPDPEPQPEPPGPTVADLRLAEFLQNDAPVQGSLNDDFDSIGIILPGNIQTPDGDANYFYHAYAAVPETLDDVVFAEYGFPSLNADLDSLQFARIFKRHAATLDSATARQNVGGYGIDWGIWEKTAALGAVAYLDKTDLQAVEDAFDNLVWAVIHAPDFGSPEGTFTYSASMDFLGESGHGALEQVQAIFDVDFGISGGLTNGYLRICSSAGGACGHGRGTVWKSDVFSSAALNQGFIPTTRITGEISENGNVVSGFAGQLTGRFTGRNDEQRNDAFLGGFNLYDIDAGSGNYVTGVFLAEREERFNPDFSASGSAGLISDIEKSPAKSIAWDRSGNVYTDLSGMTYSFEQPGLPNVIFVHNDDGALWTLGRTGDHDKYGVYSDPSHPIQLGYWNDERGFAIQQNKLDATQSSINLSPLLWVSYVPTDFAGVVGRFSSTPTSAHSGTHLAPNEANPTSLGLLKFDIDFDTGKIFNGSLRIDGRRDPKYQWNLTLDGQIDHHQSAIMIRDSALAGNLNQSPIDAEASVIVGAFRFGKEMEALTFTGIYHLEADMEDGRHEANGTVQIHGNRFDYLDLRLSADEQQMLRSNDLVGLLVKQGPGIAIGAALQQSATASPVFVHNGFGQVANARFSALPAVEVLALAEGADSAIIPVDGFEVSWGVWDQEDAIARSNRFNDNAHGAPSNDIHWAVIKPADLADLTGMAIYAGESKSADGLNDVAMSFSVDFGPGTITDGSLIITDNSTTRWHVGFGGQVDGAFATMDILNGQINNEPANIDGDIGGVFTGSGTGGTQGFVGGFSLQSGTDSVQGMTLIHQQ